MSKIPVYKAKLIKRYKRFLADVVLADGTEATIHVSNTGAMTGCADEGDYVWYSVSDNPKRKYQFSWELTEKPNGDLICVNTIRANQFIEHAITQQHIAEYADFETLQREVKYGSENSKIDFLASFAEHPDNYIEVKSATLLEGKQGFFPDTVTTRGQKHLRELIQMAESGYSATLIFAILHSGINSVRPAEHIDAKYAQAYTDAKAAGVSMLQYKVELLNHYQLMTS